LLFSFFGTFGRVSRSFQPLLRLPTILNLLEGPRFSPPHWYWNLGDIYPLSGVLPDRPLPSENFLLLASPFFTPFSQSPPGSEPPSQRGLPFVSWPPHNTSSIRLLFPLLPGIFLPPPPRSETPSNRFFFFLPTIRTCSR